MDMVNLQVAIEEARRFLDKADDALAALKADKYPDHYRGAETAAAKRASLDLTRALAKMRKPR